MQWWAWVVVALAIIALLVVAVIAVQARRRRGGVIVVASRRPRHAPAARVGVAHEVDESLGDHQTADRDDAR